ncbi:MAG: RidA family protein [Methylobacterium sp.]|nr:RidA family protein [Methylobacterium sp.]MCA3653969.1 RidA family protein [Methylobacterium sp.]MCA3657754.1 RidA family protein [Methylobacterium sp.]MCA3660226.1 RidA family protein [Methylobacterium sp.]MCA3662633.1 RidA family protein [Methylobacterium sp.]
MQINETFPHEVLHPRNWKPAKGYANGIIAKGRMVFLGGLVGWNADQEFETDDFAGQVEQTLKNIVAVLAEAGARPEHLVRLTWYVTDKHEYLASLPQIGRAYRAHVGRHFPAMALVQVVALLEDRAKVEIEATAVLPEC